VELEHAGQYRLPDRRFRAALKGNARYRRCGAWVPLLAALLVTFFPYHPY
jgi:hypothetical protein